MPTKTWDLALTQILFYFPSCIPVLYCFWRHRKFGFAGWFFLFAFLTLQIVGGILTVAAGENGTPSSTAIIITSVGISPLMFAVAGVMHEWLKLSDFPRTKKGKRIDMLCNILYHLAVTVGIAIYAVGASDASKPGSTSGGTTEWKVGIIILFLLVIVLDVAFFIFWRKIGTGGSQPLFWSIAISQVLLLIRLIYQVVATFKEDKGEYSYINGSIALRVVFQFLTGAFITLALVIAGVMSLETVALAQTRKAEGHTRTVRLGKPSGGGQQHEQELYGNGPHFGTAQNNNAATRYGV